MEDLMQVMTAAAEGPAPASADGEPPETEGQQALVKKWLDTIRRDAKHWERAFERMREDQKFAANTNNAQWDGDEGKYVANLTLRHVSNKVSALYAKNPRVKAERKKRMEYTIWDGKIESLQMAMTLKEQAMASASALAGAAMGAPPPVDPATGAPAPAPPPVDPVQLMEAEALIADVVQGMQRKKLLERIGQTLEIVYQHALDEQQPGFKEEAKQLVTRVVTCGVGYVQMGYQRAMAKKPETLEKMADHTERLAHIEALIAKCRAGEDGYDEMSAKKAELDAAMKALQEEAEIIIREGLVVDFPDCDAIIPDRRTKRLRGWVGARHLTRKFMLSPEEIEEIYGVDVKKNYTGYVQKPTRLSGADAASEYQARGGAEPGDGDLGCVYEVWDKKTGSSFALCDGYPGYLRAPAKIEVLVERVFPVYPLTFNKLENQFELFPPSDVRIMRDAQQEYNRAREGLREHRRFARPWSVTTAGGLSDEDKDKIRNRLPFEIVELKGMPAGAEAAKVLQPAPTPTVDPALYETMTTFDDIQKMTGSQEANFGGVAKATATESTIAEGARVSNVEDNKDDLDEFLSLLARDGGQILLREMAQETVAKIAGPGASWPQWSRDEIAQELYLGIVAGSSGRPNKAIEVANLERVAPLLLQIPGVNPKWMARDFLTRLDDKIDLDEALAENMPSITAMNTMAGKQAQAPTGDPATDPQAQGPQGQDQTAAPGTQPGPQAAFPAAV